MIERKIKMVMKKQKILKMRQLNKMVKKKLLHQEMDFPSKNYTKSDAKTEDNSLSTNKIAIDANLLVSRKTNNIKKNYKSTKILGQGSFGTVYLVKHKLLNNLFAIKIIKKSNKNEKDDILMK